MLLAAANAQRFLQDEKVVVINETVSVENSTVAEVAEVAVVAEVAEVVEVVEVVEPAKEIVKPIVDPIVERCSNYDTVNHNTLVEPLVKKLISHFEWQQANPNKATPTAELPMIAGFQIFEFCMEENAYDPECFDIRTKGGSIESLWEMWNTNADGFIDTSEYVALETSMDLNSDGQVSDIEAKAYFIRNKFLICKPYAD